MARPPTDKSRRTPAHPAPGVADAPAGNWVDRFAPAALRPWLRLMRADRPIGVWLLLWPCWWSVALASQYVSSKTWPELWLLMLFAIGAIVMRGAGCVYNDIVDRDIDARVARTRTRPIPSGQVSVRAALVFLVVLALTGLAVLLQFNGLTILLGICSLGIVAIYPYMKRMTWWPQAILGMAFGWGALMGWTAVTGLPGLPAAMLYFASIAWVIGYDTIYAHQDTEDDALLGLKSTALKFGDRTPFWLSLFYGVTFAGIGLAGWLAGTGIGFWLLWPVSGLHLLWQIQRLDITDSATCLMIFKSNRDFGALVFAAFLLGAF